MTIKVQLLRPAATVDGRCHSRGAAATGAFALIHGRSFQR
jgi:hypothetical protein